MLVKCEHCDEEHPDKTKFCPNTGNAVNAAPAPAPVPEAASPPPVATSVPAPAASRPAAKTMLFGSAAAAGVRLPPPGGTKAAAPPVAASTPAAVPPPIASVPPAPVAAAPSAAPEAAPQEERRSRKSLPDWVVAPDASIDGAASPFSVLPDLHAPEKGIVDLLKEAFALYKANLKVFLITAAVLFLPGSLASSCALATLTGPVVAQTASLERAAERMAAKHEEIARETVQGVSGKRDPKEIERSVREMEANAAEAAQLAGTAVGGLMAFFLSALAWAVIALLVYGLIIPLTQGALTIAVADRVLGGDAGWRQYWGLLLRRLGLMLTALLPAALLCAVGFFFLVIPGLVLCFFFAFVAPVVLIEGKGGVAALKRSFAIVKSDWLRVALVFITFGVLNVIAHWIGGLLVPNSAIFFGHLLGDLVMLVLLPFPVLGVVLLYLDIRRKAEGVGPDELRNELAALRAA